MRKIRRSTECWTFCSLLSDTNTTIFTLFPRLCYPRLYNTSLWRCEEVFSANEYTHLAFRAIHKSLNRLPFCSTSSCGAPSSTIRPVSSTTTLSNSMTISRRWLTMTIVYPLNSLRIICCMSLSVAMSKLLPYSSRTSTPLSFSSCTVLVCAALAATVCRDDFSQSVSC